MTQTRARKCEGKKQHEKKLDAEDHRWRLIRAGAATRGIRVYRCRFCSHWHVGHVGQRGKPT